MIAKSVDAYVLALETVNRLSVQYRLEAFCHLICNAWELLLKARLLDQSGNCHDAIYRGKKLRGRRRESLSLRECIARAYPSDKEPIRRNVERIADLRDEATHLVISEIPLQVMRLFQACVINYHKQLVDWFGVSLSSRVPVGMMSIVYDVDPHHLDMSDKRLRRRLGKTAAMYLARYCAQLVNEHDALQRPAEFSVQIEYRVLLTDKPGEADVVLTKGSSGSQPTRAFGVPKDSCKTHPFRQCDLLNYLHDQLTGPRVNQYDFQCVIQKQKVKARSEWFYQGTVKGSPPQYSQAFADWLVRQIQQDPAFFAKARAWRKQQL